MLLPRRPFLRDTRCYDNKRMLGSTGLQGKPSRSKLALMEKGAKASSTDTWETLAQHQ